MKATFNPEAVLKAWRANKDKHSFYRWSYPCVYAVERVSKMSRFKRGGKVNSLAGFQTEKAEAAVPNGLLNAARKSGQLNLSGRGLTEGKTLALWDVKHPLLRFDVSGLQSRIQ